MSAFDDELLTENPTLHSIERLAGRDAARMMSERFGGRRFYIPLKPNRNHHISVAVGLDNAEIICKAYGGMEFDVPLCVGKRARALKLRKDKMSVSMIAVELSCTERHVYRILDAARDDLNQPSLF